MNIQGTSPSNPSPIRPRFDAAGRPPAAAKPAAEKAQETSSEPSLWEILTPEERDFFTEQASLGPLTYRPGGPRQTQSPAPTGQRIDVRG